VREALAHADATPPLQHSVLFVAWSKAWFWLLAVSWWGKLSSLLMNSFNPFMNFCRPTSSRSSKSFRLLGLSWASSSLTCHAGGVREAPLVKARSSSSAGQQVQQQQQQQRHHHRHQLRLLHHHRHHHHRRGRDGREPRLHAGVVHSEELEARFLGPWCNGVVQGVVELGRRRSCFGLVNYQGRIRSISAAGVVTATWKRCPRTPDNTVVVYLKAGTPATAPPCLFCFAFRVASLIDTGSLSGPGTWPQHDSWQSSPRPPIVHLRIPG
jgi:hypothetical protein